jgi:Tfp pilus assembly protein PilO
MMKIFFPILLLLSAGLIFFYGTDRFINDPLATSLDGVQEEARGGIKALQVEKERLNEAAGHARELRERINELASQYNSLPPERVARLDHLLPDTVDNVQLIVDINNIAKGHGMEIKDIKVKTEDERTNTPVTSRPGSMELGEVGLGFSVAGPYDVFLTFLTDLALSLRVVDIDAISLTAATAADKSDYQYNVDINTYWLK